MVTKEKILELLAENRGYLGAEYGVRRIGVFGSAAKGETSEDSDIDLIVELERPIGFKFLELVDYLEDLLGYRVDVLTSAGLQNIRVERVARSIAESIVYA